LFSTEQGSVCDSCIPTHPKYRSKPGLLDSEAALLAVAITSVVLTNLVMYEVALALQSLL